MSLNVSYKGVLSKIPCETYHKATDLLEQLSRVYNIPVKYLTVYVNSTQITNDTDISLLDLQHHLIYVIKSVFLYIRFNSTCFSTLFPLSYKVSDFLNCYIPIFKRRGVSINPQTIQIYYQKTQLDPTKTLSSYGIHEKDTIVFVEENPSIKQSNDGWESLVENLEKKIKELEKEIEEKDQCISVLSNKLSHVSFILCFNKHTIKIAS